MAEPNTDTTPPTGNEQGRLKLSYKDLRAICREDRCVLYNRQLFDAGVMPLFYYNLFIKY